MMGAMVTHESGFVGRTARLDQFQEIVCDVVRPARVYADRSGHHDFRVNQRRFEHLETTLLSYGDPVEVEVPGIDPAAQQSFVLQLMVTGLAHTIVDGGRPLEQSRSIAHLAACELPLRIRCQRDCRHFLVRIDRSVLEHAAEEFQQTVDWPDPRAELSLDTSGGRTLRRYVRYLVAEMDVSRRGEFTRCVARATEQSLLAHILAALQPSPPSRRRVGIGRPRSDQISDDVRRVTEFIEAHLQVDIGLHDIVASSGSSLRTLYRAFERVHGTSPMAYVRNRRLARAHAELVSADAREVRVTDVALRWGFPHLSDFAIRYRERYGCLPSQTLRQH
jgi:AraC-like DNA-binding protein